MTEDRVDILDATKPEVLDHCYGSGAIGTCPGAGPGRFGRLRWAPHRSDRRRSGVLAALDSAGLTALSVGMEPRGSTPSWCACRGK
jgi:hypothetical protein